MLTKSPAPQNPLDRLTEAGLAWGEGTYARLAAPIGAAAFALYILLTAFTAWVMPYMDARDIWVLPGGDGLRWAGLVVLTLGVTLRLGPMLELGRRFVRP